MGGVEDRSARTDGLEMLFEHHWPGLLRLINKRFRELPGAEDVVQETFLKYSQLSAPAHNPPALLTRIALNLARNAMRSDRRRAHYEAYADLFEGEVEGRTPERHVFAAEELRRVELAVQLLPPACGEVFRLHRFEGLTQSEIAGRLGISTTAVEKSMRRAFTRLATALESSREDLPHSGSAG